jgi:hypothetical protein
MDWDRFKSNDFIGMVRIDLNSKQKTKSYYVLICLFNFF